LRHRKQYYLIHKDERREYKQKYNRDNKEGILKARLAKREKLRKKFVQNVELLKVISLLRDLV
jgi:hypothetical protein